MTTDTDGSRPVPDPTLLTTEQLHREIAAARERSDLLLAGADRLMAEKFASVDKQFELIERQRVELKLDTGGAVAAALAAAKESVAKSEAATSEQLKQISQTFATEISGLRESIAEVKERVSESANIKRGGTEKLGAIYALAGFVVAVFILGTGVLAWVN
jgi:hypothetical protein